MRLIDYENGLAFIICNVCLLSCILYQYNRADFLFQTFPKWIALYFVIDMFLNASAIFRLHHTVCTGISAYNYYYGVEMKQCETLFYHLIKTEISTIFLIMRYYIPKSTTLAHINNGVFYITFTKFRIVDLYYGLIHPDSSVYVVIQKYSPDNYLASGLLLTCCYTLYGLNVYWYIIMNRKLLDMITYNNKE